MIIVFKSNASNEQMKHVSDYLVEHGFKIHPIQGEEHTVYGIIGNTKNLTPEFFESLKSKVEIPILWYPDIELSQDSTVVEIGALSGNISLYAWKTFGATNVYAVEALPNNYKVLVANCQDSPVKTVNVAIGEHDGEVSFFEYGLRSSSSLFKIDSNVKYRRDLDLKEEFMMLDAGAIITATALCTAVFLLLEKPSFADSSIFWGYFGAMAPLQIGLMTRGIALVVVIIVEAVIFARLCSLSPVKALMVAVVLNIVSAIVGACIGYFYYDPYSVLAYAPTIPLTGNNRNITNGS